MAILCRGLSIVGGVILLGSVLARALPADDTDGMHLTERVDPFIGTGGNRYVCAHNMPGACVPFGVLRLSPDTVSKFGATATNTSGYYHPDPFILGFSHTRLCGTGAVDGGHIRVMVAGDDSPLPQLRGGMQVEFSHDDESASPGYYSVNLPEVGVRVELTATSRVGLHRYTFEAGRTPRIVIDVGSALGRGSSEDCEVHVHPEAQEVTGTARTFGSFSGRYGGLQVYFAARLRQTWKEVSLWTGDEIVTDKLTTSGDDVGVQLSFGETDERRLIEMAVALSHVSIENARENLNSELGERTFEEARAAAASTWERTLSAVQIEGGRKSDQKIFYTALYRAFTMPTLFNDVNGQYIGFDKRVHQAEGFDYYTDMSLWDTFRTTHPLYTLLVPDRHRDMLVSLVKMAEQGGNLPRWPSGAGYTNSMFGAPTEIAVAEAYLKGIRDFDVETAYRVMRKAALESAPEGAPYSGRRNIAEFIEYGYCPSDLMSKAVAKTLEYASTDAAIGRLAEALGKEEDAKLFTERGQSYRNIWNSETEFFQPRDAAGEFSTPLKPELLTYLDPQGTFTDDYVEGSALQWRWAVSHDGEGLVSLFSSREKFVEELETFFVGSIPQVGLVPNGFYWHGNQPDIHSVYLFNNAGRPDLTQKWVRWILKHKHGTGPDGIDGNDDGGTLSAWYVWSSLGLYPVVGTDRYELGSPLWDRATINMGQYQLEIIADNNATDHVYVTRVELNGQPLDRWSITHDEIAEGGTLRFVMSDQPLSP